MKTSTIVVSIVILVLLVGGVYFFYSNSSSSTGSVVADSNPTIPAVSAESNVHVINVDAKRWEYSQKEIHVKKGEKVKIVLNNIDKGHGMVIPDFGASGIDSVEFTADKAGSFEFHCPTPCGEGHPNMKGTLIVDE